jgi:ABC-2 type transport system ATP-binding protein
MLFQLQNVTKTYKKVTALRGLTVAMPEGAIGLLGPNGAGKTTMIRTLLGLISIDSGEGDVLGMDIRRNRLDVRQATGFVPEDECLFPGMSGIEFVSYAGELAGMRPRDAMQRAHEVLDYVGLAEARYRKADTYSSGMKQRLKLASAIVHDPRFLILDEPTNGMDPKGREELLAMTRDLAHCKGMSLLFSSHLLPDVEAVCDHVMVMGAGRLLASGRIDDLKRHEGRQLMVRIKTGQEQFASMLKARGLPVENKDDGLLVSLPGDGGPELLWRLAHETGVQIRSLMPRRSTLEEVFLSALSGAASPSAEVMLTASGAA